MSKGAEPRSDTRNRNDDHLVDYDLPGNDLNPDIPTTNEKKKIPLLVKIYGVLCLLSGISTMAIGILFIAMVVWAVQNRPDLISLGDPTLTVTLAVLSFIVAVVNAGALIFFGGSLLKNRRRNAARWSHVLIALTIAQLLLDIMLQGFGKHLIQPGIQLAILLVLSVTVDPSLRQERELQRRLRDLVDREAAEEGMLGRDLEGKGYIELNFFNLFWVFMVCSVIGLVLEIIWHMVVVEPGVYQDRAGLLFGPFSPIYGVGAVLLTVALNRFWRANPVVIFVVAAVIGGLFEAFVSWFMQVGFGAVAWDYTGTTLFGIPDPIAIIMQGRTSTPFMCMWGALGFVWIKLCLPRLLSLINIIPWKLRYSLTTICAVLMIVNAVMTFQALDCWYQRVSNIPETSPVEAFYARNFDNEYMEHRFQSMSITPEDSSRITSTPTVVSGSAISELDTASGEQGNS